MELKIIPVVQVLFAVILMITFSKLWPMFSFNWPAYLIVALLLLVLSVGVGISAIVSFKKHKTTVNPTKPETSSTVVNSGIYAISRNPMYLAMLIALVSLTYYLQHLMCLPVILIFISYMTRYQIIPEEQMLMKIFGQQYKDYQTKVRRWL
ncbi:MULTISPECIES: methyltransferase family protein [unclassified Colwellia]|uniref:methyltransferase family protein n=1 Tax=unclassified Colwellia TaxID=196834 RepID=UPI0015F5C8DE|nr:MULTISPECIES: isoprenylcysteine carboxylmethyltransferase family protein [unclassified Colwellia]MBA6231515.1 isoprenylcysteine carboxylmethyltransferase family protein [Colwellia sp. MB02u-7]MBA6235379.1 isoprenylcysteine carboxylmethyltransferase family protein [Colwellia sp. MB02u-11]MBA6299921.1 isoprenylcysteine carboxylmethyltransferase family protein [Colwellia sp. MB3u-22]MBA6310879.1 isoprenylcysteine carboxylmethyltransferase family protein [Colwellia sp. MB3u-64]